jgi:hypothetical protein
MTLAISANAAVVTWQTPGAITADTDVATTGSLVGAFIPGANALSTTVNGVAFAPIFVPNEFYDTAPSVASLNFGSIATLAGNPRLYGFNQYESGTPLGLSTDYTKVFSGGVGPCATGLTTFTLTLNNLTIGQDYLFQSWVNDSRSAFGYRTQTLASGNTSGVLDYNVGDVNGGTGQFVIGTFTADATTQAITYNSGDFAQISAFQVRAVSAVPEPSTYALVVGGIATLLLIRRRVQA